MTEDILPSGANMSYTWTTLPSYTALVNDDDQAIAIAYWSGGLERTWIVFKESRPCMTATCELTDRDILAKGHVTARNRSLRAGRLAERDAVQHVDEVMAHHPKYKGCRS